MFVMVNSGILSVWFKRKVLVNGECGGGEDVNSNPPTQQELNQEEYILLSYLELLTPCGYCGQKGGRYV